MIQKIQKNKFDFNDCTVFYLQRGKRQKMRAIRHVTGENPSDSNQYVITVCKSVPMRRNTTNDSLPEYLLEKFSIVSYFVADWFEFLEELKDKMPQELLTELELIEQEEELYLFDDLKKTRLVSKEAQAVEHLNGRYFYFDQKIIPKEHYISRSIDYRP